MYPDFVDEFNYQFYWFGEKNSKGLAIFVRSSIKAEKNDWETYCLRHFISLKINDSFDLIGVWASSPYIEEYYIYQFINIEKFNNNSVIIGDFNSNAIWDKSHGKRNHSEVVKQLQKIGLCSAYHFVKKEDQGNETQKTFYLYNHIDKGYHIDHCFVNENLISNYMVLTDMKWLELSDHLPIQLVLNL